MNYELRIMGSDTLQTAAKKIQTFMDLHAWQEGHVLVLMVYKMTRRFPREEMFGLTSQLRRAAVSITSNIAEGFSRPSYADKARCYSMSLGSTTEVQNQALIARDVGIMSAADFNALMVQSITVHKLLNGLIKSTRSLHMHNS